MDLDKARLDALCAHIEEHGIGELLPFLSVDEMMHIDARGTLKTYLQRKRDDFQYKRGDPKQVLPFPKWIIGRDREVQRYVIQVYKGYLNQLRGAPKRGRARQERINDIKQRFLKEMSSIRKNLEKQATREARQVRGGTPALAASAIGDEATSFEMDEWLAQIGAHFDMWAACM